MVPTSLPELPKPSRTLGKSRKSYFLNPKAIRKKSADLSACGWGCRREIVIESIEIEILVNSIDFEIEREIDRNRHRKRLKRTRFRNRKGNRSQPTSKTIKAKTIS